MASIEATGSGSAAPDGERGELLLPYVLVGPAVLVAFLIAIVPLGYGLWLSFQDWYLLRNPTPVWGGLVNYVQLVNDARALARLPPHLAWTVGTVIVEVAIGLPLALLLNRDGAVSRIASALILDPLGDAVHRARLRLAVPARQPGRPASPRPAGGGRRRQRDDPERSRLRAADDHLHLRAGRARPSW